MDGNDEPQPEDKHPIEPYENKSRWVSYKDVPASHINHDIINRKISVCNKSERITKLDYVRLLMETAAYRSADPKTKVGCVLTDDRLHVKSISYNGEVNNGEPRSVPPVVRKHIGEVEPVRNKKAFFMIKRGDEVVELNLPTSGEDKSNGDDCVIHAEMNCLIQCHGAIAFVSLIPCPQCFKMLIQYNVKNIIYFSDKGAYPDTWVLWEKHQDVNLIPAQFLTSNFNSFRFDVYDLESFCPSKVLKDTDKVVVNPVKKRYSAINLKLDANRVSDIIKTLFG